MKNIIFIPARSGSQRIPNKNIQKLNNCTLIKIAIKKALRISDDNTTVILSTDYNIEDLGLDSYELRHIYIHKRSSKVSQSNSSTESTLLEYLNSTSGSKFLKSSGYILLMQVTSPILKIPSLLKGLELYKSNIFIKPITIFSAYQYKQFTWRFDEHICKPISYDPLNRLSTQKMEDSYNETGAFYFFPIQGFLKRMNRFMEFSLPCSVSLFESLDIDNLEDLELARSIEDKI